MKAHCPVIHGLLASVVIPAMVVELLQDSAIQKSALDKIAEADTATLDDSKWRLHCLLRTTVDSQLSIGFRAHWRALFASLREVPFELNPTSLKELHERITHCMHEGRREDMLQRLRGQVASPLNAPKSKPVETFEVLQCAVESLRASMTTSSEEKERQLLQRGAKEIGALLFPYMYGADYYKMVAALLKVTHYNPGGNDVG